MLNFITKIFGNKHDKDIKAIKPIVDTINKIYNDYNQLSDEELKNKTIEFKERVKQASLELENEKAELINKLQTTALEANESLEINDRLKEIEKELFQTINETLDEILPEAFAAVKQTCKRLTEKRHAYTYAGTNYIWDMIPYDVQLIGGIVLHQGKISEMQTGEGKTLVAVLPLYLNALSGKGVHLVTVNDYLAKRDCDWMRPVYEFLGLEVDAIQSNMESSDRARIYNSDITYGTNNEFGFDYLRDNMVIDAEHMVQRGHWYAIVDEVDSVLIDEARTPLIISGPVGQTDQKFESLNPRVKRLVDSQNKLVNSLVKEFEDLIKSDKKEDKEKAGVALLRAHRGFPKHKRLAKLLQEPENQKILRETELFFMREQNRRMHEIDDELYYSIDEKNHQIDVSEKGRAMLTNNDEDPDTFVIPDIAAELSAIEGNSSLEITQKQLLRDQAHLIFSERSDRIHTLSQLLRAYSLYEKDVEYVIQDNKIMIVDEFTGRILDGRRYSDGLHQAIEAKESVKVERDTQTMATITLQNYFRLYHKLGGMTGTAETEAAEFEKIYDLDVVVIPSNRKIVRDDMDDLIYKTKREKYNAIAEEVQKLKAEGRAVLVGTASVEVSEILSKMLTRLNVKHNVLNAKQHAREAEIVSLAGQKGQVTIATNMAGRGTDIKLDAEVKKNGGLAIIGSERHDARRIDRQLRGRAGRQGDPGSSIFYISLEDNLMRLFGGDKMSSVMGKLKIPEGEPIQHQIISKTVERAQKKVEENNFGIRKRLLDYDDVMNQQRTVIYNRRKAAIRGERLKGELFDYIEELASDWVEEFKQEKNLIGLKNTIRTYLLCEIEIDDIQFEKMNETDITVEILKSAKEFYTRKEEMLGFDFMSQLEKVAVLQAIDEKWKEHLRIMDDLKEGIHLRSYGQKDPLLEYKGEAFKLFVELVRDINKESVQFAFKYFPRMVEQQPQQVQQQRPVQRQPKSNVEFNEDGSPKLKNRTVTNSLTFEHSTVTPSFLQNPDVPQAHEQESNMSTQRTYKRDDDKVGRNDLCPCGSGKKYKKCHGKNELEG